jgi:hypothetical protein
MIPTIIFVVCLALLLCLAVGGLLWEEQGRRDVTWDPHPLDPDFDLPPAAPLPTIQRKPLPLFPEAPRVCALCGKAGHRRFYHVPETPGPVCGYCVSRRFGLRVE